MNIKKNIHCANCYNCRAQYNRAWCKENLWFNFKNEQATKMDVDIKSLIVSQQYLRFAEKCPLYQSMIG